MGKAEFKYIQAGFKKGEPAHINFYDDVDNWSVQDFLSEFHYLETWIEPSEIVIHINSAGGCVVDGMSVFSAIVNSKYPTKTINDGLAASMGSVIWSAGKEIYMKDYGLLMIHNPFSENKENGQSAIIESFKKQLATIYTKRFGLSEDEVKSIMDGEGDNDGTWYTADEAVNAGFISQEHIIETEQAIKSKIAAKINGVKDTKKLVSIMATAKYNAYQKPKENNTNLNNNQEQMANEITLVAALLGLTGDKATEANVSAKVKALLDAEGKYSKANDDLKTANATIDELKVKITAHETTISNLTKNYNDAKAKLSAFEKKEADAKKASIEAMVDDAIAKNKISKEARTSWINLAENNFETTKAALDGIPAMTQISGSLNPGVKPEDLTPEAEKEIQSKIDDAVGKDFEFNKWQ